MIIERQELCGLIPHDGAMCLLDGVLEWDEKRIVCRSDSHRLADNPLRSNDRLTAIHGVEYAAQAMALHGGLLARQRGESNPPGFLVALRDVNLYVQQLDDIDAGLEVEAIELLRSGGSFIYEFRVTAEGQLLLDGRVTVMIQEAG